MKQIVIFGGTGFIGTHTAQRLLQDPTSSVLLLSISVLREPSLIQLPCGGAGIRESAVCAA